MSIKGSPSSVNEYQVSDPQEFAHISSEYKQLGQKHLDLECINNSDRST